MNDPPNFLNQYYILSEHIRGVHSFFMPQK